MERRWSGRRDRPPDNRRITDSKAYILLTTTAALWGFSWVCGRLISNEGIPPAQAALARFTFGSAGLLVLVAANRTWPRVNTRQFLTLLGMGLSGVFLYNVCFFTGLKTVPAGRASLMASMQPAFVFLFSAAVWGERVTKLKIAGLVVSFVGALLVLSHGHPADLFANGLSTGDLWVIGCVFSWVAYTLIGRTIMGQLPSGAVTAYSTWLGTALLFGLVLTGGATSPQWSLRAWMAVAFLGIAATTVGFLFYLRGLAQIGASRTSIFVNLVPVFGVLSSALVLGESLGLSTLIGGVLVIAGVRMLNR